MAACGKPDAAQHAIGSQDRRGPFDLPDRADLQLPTRVVLIAQHDQAGPRQLGVNFDPLGIDIDDAARFDASAGGSLRGRRCDGLGRLNNCRPPQVAEFAAGKKDLLGPHTNRMGIGRRKRRQSHHVVDDPGPGHGPRIVPERECFLRSACRAFVGCRTQSHLGGLKPTLRSKRNGIGPPATWREAPSTASPSTLSKVAARRAGPASRGPREIGPMELAKGPHNRSPSSSRPRWPAECQRTDCA